MAMRFSPVVFLVAVSMAMMASGPSGARTLVSLQVAEQICLERVQRFAQRSFGIDFDHPDRNQIKDRFRACVYAKSKQYPQRKLKVRGAVVTLP